MLLPTIIVTDYCKCKPLSDISHLAIPKGGLDLFLNSSSGGAERRCERKTTPGLDCIKHSLLKLCHIFAYLTLWVCVRR